MARQIVATPKAARPPSTYSQAVKAAGLVFVSGTAPVDPASGAIVAGTIQEQTRHQGAKVTGPSSRAEDLHRYDRRSIDAGIAQPPPDRDMAPGLLRDGCHMSEQATDAA